MGNYEPSKIPESGRRGIDPKWLFTEFHKIATAINSVDERNYRNPVDASTILEAGTVTLEHLSTRGEWRIPIIALATAYTTTSTNLVNVGQYAYFDLVRWRDVPADHVFLEITGGPLSVGTATFELHDTEGTLASITTSTVGLQWIVKEFDRLPEFSGTLVLKMKTSSGSVQAGIVGANVLIRP